MRGHRRLRSRDPELCKAEAGIFEPVIDRLRCTAEGPCIKACPFDVLAFRQIPAEQRADYPWLLRMRLASKGAAGCRD